MPQNKSNQDYIIIDLSFSVEQLEDMLKNAKAGGAVQIKVKLNTTVTGELQEVILR